jgi:MFS family permease
MGQNYLGEGGFIRMYKRNIAILSISQALGLSAVPAITLLGGIIGAALAPTPVLATLPVSLVIVGVALFTFPAVFTMKRIGRRNGFLISAIGAGLACLLAAFAVSQASFVLYCLATLLIGGNSAFVSQYRFAAAESVTPQYVGRAISFVLMGGIAAGILGPEIVKRTQASGGDFTTSFLVLAGLYACVFLLMIFLKEPVVQQESITGTERPLRSIVSQPIFLTALAASVIGYGVMTFIMTATPVNMHVIHGFDLADTAWVIQSHIIAMFLPSLFTAFLIQRLGLLRLMSAGLVALLLCVLLALLGEDLLHYWWALVLLGMGWNFLFVGGTTLLTRSYQPVERFKVQATNDFTVFSIQALASLSAGAVLYTAGWNNLVLLTVPFLLALAVGLVFMRRHLTHELPAVLPINVGTLE